jgi:adenylosuccinate synthase
VTDYDALPQAARNYLSRIEALLEVPIVLLSTGPQRHQTIVK